MLYIDANNIVDLEVAPDLNSHELTETSRDHQDNHRFGRHNGGQATDLNYSSPLHATSPSTFSAPTGSEAFFDPAIISFQKMPVKSRTGLGSPSPKTRRPFTPPQMLAEAAKKSSAQIRSTVSVRPTAPTGTKTITKSATPMRTVRHDSLTTATLTQPFDDLSVNATSHLEEGSGSGAAELETKGDRGEGFLTGSDHGNEATYKLKYNDQSRKRAKSTKDISTRLLPVRIQEAEKLISLPVQTTIMENVDPTTIKQLHTAVPNPLSHQGSFKARQQPKHRAGKRNRHDRWLTKEAQNGWATEDATDIQEMGDFDFVGNLSKFDKRELFNQLRKDDSTAIEARLVNHNRVPPRVGTAGGKNLHWTENVLDLPQVNGLTSWASEAGESDEEVSEARTSSGISSRRTTSQTTLKNHSTRKGSMRVIEGSSVAATKLSTASVENVKYSTFDQNDSVRPKHNMSQSPYTGSLTASRPSLRIAGSNRHCPCLSPLQMLEFEQFATTELGLSEDTMTENAARGIAEAFLDVVRGGEHETMKHRNLPTPIILLAAGNHKSGARSLAAARHLRNRGFQIFATVMGMEWEEDLLDIVKQQANAYRKAGGNLERPSELLEALKTAQRRPTFLIDALLGTHTCFEDLRRDDQAFCYELVLWVTHNDIDILSIDVPSGVDPLSGNVPPFLILTANAVYLTSLMAFGTYSTQVN